MRDVGLTRLPFAEGHSGGTVAAYVVATREAARHSPVTALYPGTIVRVATTLLRHGTAEQVAKHLPAPIAGEALAAWASTEPATGPDPRQIATRTRRDGTCSVLDGVEQFISLAGQADLALVCARTSESALGAFLVDTVDPGWQPGPPSEVLPVGGTEARPVAVEGIRVHDGELVGSTDGFGVL